MATISVFVVIVLLFVFFFFFLVFFFFFSPVVTLFNIPLFFSAVSPISSQ